MHPAEGTAGRGGAPRWLLLVGLAAGTLAAAWSLARGAPGALPAEAVAMVDGRPILRDAWLRAVAAVASERRTPLTGADQRHVLERLIDEELLVQHGLALGLAERDARLRSVLVDEVMQAASATAAAPDEAELRRFHAEHAAYFAPAPQLRVAALRLEADGARRPWFAELPDALLPLAKLRAYLGPELAAAAARLAPGEAVELETAQGRVRLELRERREAATPPYEAVRDAVRAEWRRRADEQAVRSLLAELRRRHDVVVDPALP